mmetsp:Transcript_20288/g.45286  ORF Transcript_20288/g.45286 Transcript_20288/m.45286 type:complete len:252 (-) Transcript_20288:1029-1784(-)
MTLNVTQKDPTHVCPLLRVERPHDCRVVDHVSHVVLAHDVSHLGCPCRRMHEPLVSCAGAIRSVLRLISRAIPDERGLGKERSDERVRKHGPRQLDAHGRSRLNHRRRLRCRVDGQRDEEGVLNNEIARDGAAIAEVVLLAVATEEWKRPHRDHRLQQPMAREANQPNSTDPRVPVRVRPRKQQPEHVSPVRKIGEPDDPVHPMGEACPKAQKSAKVRHVSLSVPSRARRTYSKMWGRRLLRRITVTTVIF